MPVLVAHFSSDEYRIWYGFGAIIASLPGFAMISHAMSSTFTNPLVNGAVTTTVLAGITGSASGGMSIALSAMAEQYNAAILAAGIPPEVMHVWLQWHQAVWIPYRTMVLLSLYSLLQV